MTVFYPNPCYNEVCYKETALYNKKLRAKCKQENLSSGFATTKMRPACASAQSDQHLCNSLSCEYSTQACSMQNCNYSASLCS